jgi:polyphosphate kinase 2 (PPK2 family)
MHRMFGRSSYEDGLITRVHGGLTGQEARYRLTQLRACEQMLTNNGTRILMYVRHLSEAEQEKRLRAHLDGPNPRWTFSPQDRKERGSWKAYQRAFEHVLSATSTDEAP